MINITNLDIYNKLNNITRLCDYYFPYLRIILIYIMKKFNYKNLTPQQKGDLIAKAKYKESNKDLKKLFKKQIRRDAIDLNLLNKLINELP